jgi:hypothetical protein
MGETYMEGNALALLLSSVIGLVLMFAQLKLFSIDTKLRRIVELMEHQARQQPGSDKP